MELSEVKILVLRLNIFELKNGDAIVKHKNSVLNQAGLHAVLWKSRDI